YIPFWMNWPAIVMHRRYIERGAAVADAHLGLRNACRRGHLAVGCRRGNDDQLNIVWFKPRRSDCVQPGTGSKVRRVFVWCSDVPLANPQLFEHPLRGGWQVCHDFFVGQDLGRNVRAGGFDADTIKVAVSASHSSLQSPE